MKTINIHFQSHFETHTVGKISNDINTVFVLQICDHRYTTIYYLPDIVPSVTQSYSHVYTCTASPSQALTSPSTLSQFLVFFCLFPSLVFLCLSLPASHLLVQSLVSHLFSVSVIILLSCPEFAPVSHLLMVSLSFDCSCVPGLYFVFCYLPLFLGSIWGFYGCVLQLYCIKASLPVNHLSARVSCIWAHLPCMTVTLSGCTHSP